MSHIAPPQPHFRLDPLADPGEGRRWFSSLATVLALHTVPALIAAYWLGPVISTPAPEAAVMIDLAPLASPPTPLSEQPPGPKQEKAEAPQPKVEQQPVKTPLVTNPAVTLPTRLPKPPKVEAKQAAPETTAPPARPAPPASRASSGRPTWEGLVLGHLDRFKRFPRDAQFRREQGVPWIRFVVDRQGQVISSRLERTSRFRSLDLEAVALPKRAQPLPKPPEDMPGETIELVVPVEFFLN
jgi:protein TonB